MGEKAGLQPISLSKLSAIKKANFSEYITKRRGDKFARCSNCEKLKRLRDAHTMGTKSYIAHQLNYFKHVNMQEAHRNDYYTNRALSISLPLEGLRSSMTKWIMPKQPPRILQIESKPQMDFSSFLCRLQVNVENNSITYP